MSEATVPELAADPALVAEYRALALGEFPDGERGRLLFVVSTDDLAEAKGDLYVALGLAKYLRRLGWGITLWPTPRWGTPTPEGIDAVIVMIESYVPGLVPDGTQLVAWVRNWTDVWAALPYLDRFTQIWCSSAAAAERIAEAFTGRVEVVPLATDLELFRPLDVPRRSAVVTTANYWGKDRTLIGTLSVLSEDVHVSWYGRNAQFLDVADTIDHRESIDYFLLPWVYSSWRIVIDDVIEAAAAYGTQNSRLFDAIACGAIVITNTENGLRDLDLGAVPVYTEVGDLKATVASFDDPVVAGRRADALREVVVAKHGWAQRALQTDVLLGDALRRTAADGSPLLRWAALLQEELRSVTAERDEARMAYWDLTRAHQDAHRRIDVLQRRAARRLLPRVRRGLRRLLRRDRPSPASPSQD